MKRILVTLAVMTFMGIGTSAFATSPTSSGSLAVSGTVVSSIAFTVEAAGGSTSGLSTNAASTALGSVSKYGSAPTGFTLTPGSSDWTLSSNVGVKVVKANSASATYALTAQLSGAPATGVSWSLNSVALTAATAGSITSTGTYAATPSYAWTIAVTDAAVATTALDNTINFIATSN
jgi:hypothetical protein